MILFLDFDGVLHPSGKNKNLFSEVEKLWAILRPCPTLQVVFSTSWRDTYSFESLLDFVTAGGGEDLCEQFVGMTPNLEGEGCYGRRDLEIKQWLALHAPGQTWLALDDMSELFAPGYLNLYQVNGSVGLTDFDVLQISQKLC